MATVLIHDGCLAGAMAGLIQNRVIVTADPTNAQLVQLKNAAAAIATQCLTANTALGVPMADADHAAIATLCFGAAFAVMSSIGSIDATATDWATQANQIIAQAKAVEASMTS